MKFTMQPLCESLYEKTRLTFFFPKGTDLSAFTYFDLSEEYEIEVKRVRQKRTLSQNAYYQVLAHKVAEERKIPFAEYHNRNLAEMGIPKKYNGQTLYFLGKDSDWYLHQLSNETHFCPTANTEERKGITYRWFYQVKGSSEYNTKELSTLIDKVIEDAKALGIQVETEDELLHLKQLWEDNK